MDTESVFTALDAPGISGLSSESAKENLKKWGYNLLSESVPRSGLSIWMDQFKSLPVALLAAAAGVSIFTGGVADALVIFGAIAMNATLGYVTESQSEKTIYSLKSLIKPSVLVRRNGILKEIKAEEVVPGDILILKPGSYVAADGRLLEAHHLSVDESALTGESMPISKTSKLLTSKKEIPLADRANMVYRGTLVMGGQGIAVVVATGPFTEMGQIQTLVEGAKSPETHTERQLNYLGHQLVQVGRKGFRPSPPPPSSWVLNI
jgi:Ca2+-transporting ATPase